jgi:hypothetical protein
VTVRERVEKTVVTVMVLEKIVVENVVVMDK